mgnify:CR=1 FL=1
MKIKNFLNLRTGILFIFIGLINPSNYSEVIKYKNNKKVNKIEINDLERNYKLISQTNWEIIESDNPIKTKKYEWKKLNKKDFPFVEKNKKLNLNTKLTNLSSHNRSIVIDSNFIGPDISWLVPPGFTWSENHYFDFSSRGHNRRKKGERFFGWNNGDAVGQIHWQPIKLKNKSLGLNLGIRSMQGSKDGNSAFGEGLSLGFRYDKRISAEAGYAIGAEQLINFDNTSDTGRDIYLTISKGWWKNKSDNQNPFPLITATAGFATGKMAEGNIKGLCSDLFGGSGTEYAHQRRLCWAPVFSLAKVFNRNFSTFFEYNSYWFLLGTSLAPFENFPIRGTFALQLSDHIDNYKPNKADELKWVFRISYGF